MSRKSPRVGRASRPPSAPAHETGGPAVRPPRRELRPVLLAALGVMMLTCVPYLIASLPGYAAPGLRFQGFLWGIDDANVYRSYVRQHADGHFFAFDQYTTEPQNPRFVNLLFLSMGLVCRLTGLSGVLVYHLFRFVGGVLLLYLVYLVAAEIGLGRRGRWAAFLLASFSSGLGWIVYRGVTGGSLSQEAANRLAPIDVASGWVAMPEAVTFLSLLGNALFVFGIALMLAVVLWGLRAARESGWRATLVTGGLLFLLGNLHTYNVVVLYPLLGLLFLAGALRRERPWPQALGRFAVICLLGLPTLVWQYYVQTVDPIWAAKYLVPKSSPPLSGYLLGYGLLLPAALLGAVYTLLPLARRERGQGREAPSRAHLPSSLMPVIWLGLGFALVYAPLGFQRKLAEGLHLPLCLLAALAFERLSSRLTASSYRALFALFLVMTVPSNLYYVAGGLLHARLNNLDLAPVNYPPSYLTADELAALRWLGENTSPDDVVFSSVYTGNHIPPHAPCRVVAGHWDETIHFGRYLALTQRFYTPLAPPEVRRFTLAESRANLVFYGPQERLLQRLLTLADPDGMRTADITTSLPELSPAFQQGEVTLYRVSRPLSSPP